VEAYLSERLIHVNAIPRARTIPLDIDLVEHRLAETASHEAAAAPSIVADSGKSL
jgi:hypothetical protein